MSTNVRDSFLQDPWVHIGALLAIAIGLFADRYLQLGLGATTSLVFIIGGLAILGVKITNGTAARINNAPITAANTAALAAAEIVKNAVATAAAQVINETASAAAAQVKATAAAAVPSTPWSPVEPPKPAGP